jgi:hypothetical protein
MPVSRSSSDSFATALRAVRILIVVAVAIWFFSWIEYAIASEPPAPREPVPGFREAGVRDPTRSAPAAGPADFSPPESRFTPGLQPVPAFVSS